MFGKKAVQNPMQGGYDTTLVPLMGDTNFNTVAKIYALAQVAAGITARIFEFTVPARYLYCWGWGILNAVNNQGYLTLGIFKAGTGIQTNRITLAVESYDRHNFQPVKEFVDIQANLGVNTSYATMTGTQNNNGMLALPMSTVIALPWSRLAINAYVIVAQANLDSVFFSIPITAKSS